ncbi:FAD-binding protein [candidate division CSSED10-310 bacterium]|uniref:D-lactate dehydrogenase (cytochrome) n=1 Tax=candidate division CSSED10-310 bacterium TaxID=2855610 RepID=A0ABV6YVP5_UNCC1
MSVTHLLHHSPEELNPYGLFRLSIYIYLGSILFYLRHFWYHVADRDTIKRRLKINILHQSLFQKVSAECRILKGYGTRRLYSRNLARVPVFIEKLLYRTTPHLVAQVKNEEDIRAILQFAVDKGLAVFPRGISSSAFGGTTPTQNGIVLDLSRMNDIKDLDREQNTIRVEPGVRWADLIRYLEPYGLTVLTHPSSVFSTVGGWAATGGYGLYAYKYGPFREAIVSANIIFANGERGFYRKGDPDLENCIGTEGQIGIFTSLTLTVKKKPLQSNPYLFTFQTSGQAFEFINQCLQEKLNVAHMAFFDRQWMIEENHMFADKTGRETAVVDEVPSVLVLSDEPGSTLEIESLAQRHQSGAGGLTPAARYLWNERYFPLKAQRLGPNMLAAEIVIKPSVLPILTRKSTKLFARFGISPAIEATICSASEEPCSVVIFSFRTNAQRALEYCFHLLCVQLVTLLALRLGGRPYGVGIWNTPFASSIFSRVGLRHLAQQKKKFDPRKKLNPRKFFALQSRFGNGPGFFFRAHVFLTLLSLFSLFSLILGALTRLLKPKGELHWQVPDQTERHGLSFMEQTMQRCTFCGSCISICPAYALTDNELVTGRGKLHLAELVMHKQALEMQEIFDPFQCLRCHLCEEVCQTRLPLLDFYDAFEDYIQRSFGPCPDNIVQDFLQRVDESRNWIQNIYGLDLATWAPPGMMKTLPGARPQGGSE